MTDNVTELQSLRPVNPASAVANLITMAQIERDLPATMSGVDAMETLAEAVAAIAERVSRDEAVILLGVGGVLLRMTRGCPRPEGTPDPWPAGLVAYVEAMLPSVSELTQGETFYDALGRIGPSANVPAIYVRLLCERVKLLERRTLFADTMTRAEVADAIGASMMASPAGEA